MPNEDEQQEPQHPAHETETKEQEIARTEAARAAGTLIEATCVIDTGGIDES
jgi:hypothetical protein